MICILPIQIKLIFAELHISYLATQVKLGGSIVEPGYERRATDSAELEHQLDHMTTKDVVIAAFYIPYAYVTNAVRWLTSSSIVEAWRSALFGSDALSFRRQSSNIVMGSAAVAATQLANLVT